MKRRMIQLLALLKIDNWTWGFGLQYRHPHWLVYLCRKFYSASLRRSRRLTYWSTGSNFLRDLSRRLHHRERFRHQTLNERQMIFSLAISLAHQSRDVKECPLMTISCFLYIKSSWLRGTKPEVKNWMDASFSNLSEMKSVPASAALTTSWHAQRRLLYHPLLGAFQLPHFIWILVRCRSRSCFSFFTVRQIRLFYLAAFPPPAVTNPPGS